MVAKIAVPADYDLPSIAAAAGNGDVEARRYADGLLYVEGVTQQQLDDALAGYDNAARLAAALESSLTDALNEHLNAVAGQRRYDNRFTCSLRAGYSGAFQAEGQAFAAWMDACNMAAYGIMAQCKLGLRPVPTESELIEEMPVMVWPPSPIPPDAVELAALAAAEAVQ